MNFRRIFVPYCHVFSNLIYAGDMNTGLYVLEFDNHVAANFTGAVVDDKSSQPIRGAMVYFRDEYPNPVSSSIAQIIFRLPVRAEAQLEVYNVYGQRVRQLLRAAREPGEHRLAWDGAEETGKPVTAGVYIMRLRAGKFIAERKMTIVR